MSKILRGGEDRFDTAPLDPAGNRDTNDNPELDDMLGCHTGTAFGLNVVNPPVGFTPVWERNNGRDIAAAKRRGGIPAHHFAESGSVASKEVSDLGPTQLDSADIYSDVTLFYYPDDVLRKRREEQQKRSLAQLRGSAEEYVSRATPAELQSGTRRFAQRKHVTEVRAGFNEDAPIEQVWAPDSGILEESE